LARAAAGFHNIEFSLQLCKSSELNGQRLLIGSDAAAKVIDENAKALVFPTLAKRSAVL
jgi:hypothetical protein